MLSTVTIQIRADTDNSNGANNKESVCQCRRYKRHRFHFWTRKIAWRRDGNPLQYSCLENLVDKGAWWAVVHGGHKELGMTEELNTSHSYCSHADILFLFVTLRTDLLRYVIY